MASGALCRVVSLVPEFLLTNCLTLPLYFKQDQTQGPIFEGGSLHSSPLYIWVVCADQDEVASSECRNVDFLVQHLLLVPLLPLLLLLLYASAVCFCCCVGLFGKCCNGGTGLRVLLLYQ